MSCCAVKSGGLVFEKMPQLISAASLLFDSNHVAHSWVSCLLGQRSGMWLYGFLFLYWVAVCQFAHVWAQRRRLYGLPKAAVLPASQTISDASSRNSTPERHGGQAREVSMFYSLWNALVFLEHLLLLKPKEKWRGLGLSIIPVQLCSLWLCKYLGCWNPDGQEAAGHSADAFAGVRCPLQVLGLPVPFSLACSPVKIQHPPGSSLHLYGFYSSSSFYNEGGMGLLGFCGSHSCCGQTSATLIFFDLCGILIDTR